MGIILINGLCCWKISHSAVTVTLLSLWRVSLIPVELMFFLPPCTVYAWAHHVNTGVGWLKREAVWHTYGMGHIHLLLKVFSLSNSLWWALSWKTKIYMFFDRTHKYISYLFYIHPFPQPFMLVLFRLLDW